MIPHLVGGLVALPCCFMLMILALSIASLAFWIWALVDCINNEPSEGNEKVIWVVVIVFLHAFGALLYVLIRRPERIRRFGK